ncbi:MAG: hypothetical protein ACREHV_08550 [Rhizomicrobium sp.]
MSADPYTRAWLSFCFDEDCRLTDRGVYGGLLPEAARTLHDASLSQSKPIDIAAVVMCAPCIAPEDLKRVVCDVAALKLPHNLRKLLYPAQRLLWGDGR